MKKNIFAAVLTVATAIGGYHYYNATVTENLSDIAKANIEALASIPAKVECYNSITSDSATWTLYCGTCTILPGRPDADKPDGECSIN